MATLKGKLEGRNDETSTFTDEAGWKHELTSMVEIDAGTYDEACDEARRVSRLQRRPMYVRGK